MSDTHVSENCFLELQESRLRRCCELALGILILGPQTRDSQWSQNKKFGQNLGIPILVTGPKQLLDVTAAERKALYRGGVHKDGPEIGVPRPPNFCRPSVFHKSHQNLSHVLFWPVLKYAPVKIKMSMVNIWRSRVIS